MSEIEKADARKLTDDIKAGLADALPKLRDALTRVADAYRLRVWHALGYDCWDTYCTTEFGDIVTRSGIGKAIEVLSGEGLSTRAIAPIVGVSHATVARQVAVAVSNETPGEPITGVDAPRTASTTLNDTRSSAGPADAPTTPRPVTGLDGKTYQQRDEKREVAAARAAKGLVTRRANEERAHTERVAKVRAALPEHLAPVFDGFPVWDGHPECGKEDSAATWMRRAMRDVEDLAAAQNGDPSRVDVTSVDLLRKHARLLATDLEEFSEFAHEVVLALQGKDWVDGCDRPDCGHDHTQEIWPIDAQ